LPGYRTAAENSLKNDGKNVPNGDEIFLATCGMMSTGTRTVLVSRWRTGGRTAVDLVREFAQELPHASAANAWQRSVLLEMETPIDVESEPRVQKLSPDDGIDGSHPFFWSGYLLIDAAGAAPDAGAQAAK
jgi:CHAT domain-containing protein